jgi:hypothetical protein
MSIFLNNITIQPLSGDTNALTAIGNGSFSNNLTVGDIDSTYRLNISGSTGRLFYDGDAIRNASRGADLIVSTKPDLMGGISIRETPDNGVGISMYLVGEDTPNENPYFVFGEPRDVALFATSRANNLNIMNNSGTDSTNNIRFYAGSGGNLSDLIPTMHLQGSGSTKGFVGINTSSPQKTLSINGDIRLTRSTTNSDIVAINFYSGLYFGNNLQYAGSGDPLLSANTSYIDGVGASNRGGTLLLTRANSQTNRGLYFYTAPDSTGAGDPATLTEQFRVTPTSGFFRNKLSVGLIGGDQTALLNIRAQGSLSSDEVLRVRNNADTINNFMVLGNGRTEFRANAIAGTPELIARFRIEDSTSSLSITNFTNTDGVFVPTIVGDQQSEGIGAISIIGRITSEHDTGTVPVISMSTRIGDTDPVAVRPLFRFRNFTTDVFQVNADRSITITNIIKAYSGGGQLNLRDNNVNNSWSLTSDNGNYGTGSTWVYGLSNNGTQVGYQITSTEAIGLSLNASGINPALDTAKEIIISDNRTNTSNSGDFDKRAILIGTRNSTIASSITNSVVLGGVGISATQDDTVYVDRLNIKTVTSGTSIYNLGLDTNGNVVQASGGIDKFSFTYNVANNNFYDDGNIRLSWLSTQRMRLVMLTEPGGTGDLRSNFRTDGGTTQGTFIVVTATNYDLNTVAVGPGMVAEWSVGAENDPTYPTYEIRAFTTNPHVIITITKII